MKCYAVFFGTIFFHPLIGGNSFLRNVGTNLEISTAWYLRRPKCTCFIATDKSVIPQATPICLICHSRLSWRYFNKEIFSFSKRQQKLNTDCFLQVHLSRKSIVLLEVPHISPLCPSDKSGT